VARRRRRFVFHRRAEDARENRARVDRGNERNKGRMASLMYWIMIGSDAASARGEKEKAKDETRRTKARTTERAVARARAMWHAVARPDWRSAFDTSTELYMGKAE